MMLALRAAAYFATGDRAAARVCLEEFKTEEHNDPQTIAKVNALREKRDGRAGVPGVSDPAERRKLTEEINRLWYRPRNIPAANYTAIANLLRFVGADTDALILLERGVEAWSSDSQLRADYILARIACAETAARGNYRRPLAEEIATLLKMRRPPSAKVWADIYTWLVSPAAATDKAAAALVPEVRKLLRPDLKGIGLF
jgi:hypothetical protein